MGLKASTPTIWGRVRAAGRILFGYDAVKNSRSRKNRGLSPLRGEEIELPQYERDRLISTLFDFKRNNPVVKAISRLRKTDIVGGGIKPQPSTPFEDFNTEAQRLWQEWCRAPEVTGQMNMADVQKELVDSTLFYGDIGVAFTRGGAIQLIEGSRIGNKSMTASWSETDPNKQGVIVDSLGRPIFYNVGKRINGQLKDIKQISAQNFILHFKRMRPSQWRGVPELASCVNSLQDLDEYEGIEMISAKVSASLSAVVKKENAAQFELIDRMGEADQDTVGRLERFEPGTFHYLEPGEDVSTISTAGRPNVEGISFCVYHLRKVGAAIGIPVEFILSTIGESSFSASQGLVLTYQSAIEEEQRGLASTLEKIYRWKLRTWIADKMLPEIDGDPFAVRWQMPGFRWINKVAQAKSDISYLQAGAMSLDDVAAQFGYTAESVLVRKAQNIRQAAEIAEKFGIAGGWKELFNPIPVFASVDFTDLIEPQQKPPNTNERES